jgi:hypothetical protein
VYNAARVLLALHDPVRRALPPKFLQFLHITMGTTPS